MVNQRFTFFTADIMGKKYPDRTGQFNFLLTIIAVGLVLLFFLISPALGQEKKAPEKSVQVMSLKTAVVCEGIKDYAPINEAVVFSTAVEKVYCYSFFESIPEKAQIFHNWYFRDRLSARIKLAVKPPIWRTYSTIQLREADKGPWRVDITDGKGKIFSTLRFSITD